MSGIVDPDLINDLEEIQPTFGESNCYDDYVFIPRGHHPEVYYYLVMDRVFKSRVLEVALNKWVHSMRSGPENLKKSRQKNS